MGLDAQMQQRVVLGDNMRYPLTFHTSLWDGIDRLEQRFVWRHTMGHPLMAHSILLRYGMDSWAGSCIGGHHGTFLHVPWYPLESEGWDGEIGETACGDLDRACVGRPFIMEPLKSTAIFRCRTKLC